jgi:hypothetical protein
VEDFDAGFVLEGEAERFFVAVYLASKRVAWDERWGRGTEKKYALSPMPSLPDPSLYLAYGGPQCRVSSPLVGCSTFITSALGGVSLFGLKWGGIVP